MDKYVSLDKRSKKAQREYHAKQRRTWGELNPVTRSVPSGKTYNRKKEKQRTGKEFRNGFDAGFYIIPDRNHEGIENAQFNTRQLSVHSTIIQTVEQSLN